MEEAISGIYKIINTKTNKVYISGSKNIFARWKDNLSKLNNGKHSSIKLQQSYRKTKDKTVFKCEVVEVIEDIKNFKEREKYWIEYYDSFYNGYNCIMPDNPHINVSNNRKDKIKAKVELLYNEFWELYDVSYCNIGTTMLSRLEDNHYSTGTLNQLILGLKWFTKTYDTNKYTMTFKYDRFVNSPPVISITTKDYERVDYFYIVKNKLTKDYKF